MANAVLKRARGLFDEELKREINMKSTYRSRINIKFGRHYFDFLGQQTYNTSGGVDWSKGTIMFDFPSYRPSVGDEKRFNEPFYRKVANALIDEFPCRPHWTKNTREYLARFKAVRQKFDPNGIYRNVIGEILEMY
ncbi:uncharacterized protein QC761_0015520 [Podospora bellae-mahoneyi]|uniref:D-arabinono-1,4-lactone oxidase C-terminal domain-containing protein n=1 Tax=Podospora bellae-mahoneyi TaxID=2093777 RepID=A0ABR0FZH4_9PEZI|nr:hypothetical protein QC761_0015520 [Podospora bellae-mahoneyi]